MNTHIGQQADNFKRILKLVKEKDKAEAMNTLLEIATSAHRDGVISIMSGFIKNND